LKQYVDRLSGEPARRQACRSFRIPGKKDLEPAIKLESLHAIRPHSPPHIVRTLKNLACDARLRQTARTGKPR
jgi:hypothetical protein